MQSPDGIARSQSIAGSQEAFPVQSLEPARCEPGLWAAGGAGTWLMMLWHVAESAREAVSAPDSPPLVTTPSILARAPPPRRAPGQPPARPAPGRLPPGPGAGPGGSPAPWAAGSAGPGGRAVGGGEGGRTGRCRGARRELPNGPRGNLGWRRAPAVLSAVLQWYELRHPAMSSGYPPPRVCPT